MECARVKRGGLVGPGLRKDQLNNVQGSKDEKEMAARSEEDDIQRNEEVDINEDMIADSVFSCGFIANRVEEKYLHLGVRT